MNYHEKTRAISIYAVDSGIYSSRGGGAKPKDLATAAEVSGQDHAGRTAKNHQLQVCKGRDAHRSIKGVIEGGSNVRDIILIIISAIASFEFIIGACLIEGGSFGYGSLLMSICIIWFLLLLIKSGLHEADRTSGSL